MTVTVTFAALRLIAQCPDLSRAYGVYTVTAGKVKKVTFTQSYSASPLFKLSDAVTVAQFTAIYSGPHMMEVDEIV